MSEIHNGEIVEVKSFCSLGPQLGINIRHFEVSGTTGHPTDQQVADFYDGVCAGNYPPIITANANYEGVTAQVIFPTRKPFVFQNGSATPGLVTGDPMPGQVSGIIKLQTLFAGRKFRGRLYIPFPGESDSGGSGLPTTGYMTNLANLGTLWTTTLVLGGPDNATLNPVIWHRTALNWDFILGFTTRQVWATQRRRGVLGRPNTLPWSN